MHRTTRTDGTKARAPDRQELRHAPLFNTIIVTGTCAASEVRTRKVRVPAWWSPPGGQVGMSDFVCRTLIRYTLYAHSAVTGHNLL